MSIFKNTKTLSKVLRKFRVDNELTGKELAEKLKISPAFLSRIEKDKCNTISEKLRCRLVNLFKEYHFSDSDILKLQCLIDIANGKVSLVGLPAEQKKIAVRLASMDLTEAQIEQINKLLGSL